MKINIGSNLASTKKEIETKPSAEKHSGNRAVSLDLKDDIAVVKINIPHARVSYQCSQIFWMVQKTFHRV